MAETSELSTRPGVTESDGYGREFRLYAVGQAVSVVGDRIALIALVFLVIRLSKGFAPAVSLFYVVQVLPTLLGGVLSGAIVDRFDRRHLMIGCDLGRAALLVIVPALSSVALWTIFPMVAVLYGMTVVFNTAANAALPDVVPESQLMGANAMLQGIRTAADLAYAVGGLLVFALKYQTPFYIDAATFVFSAGMITGMRVPGLPAQAKLRIASVVADLGVGFRFTWAQPFVKWSTLTMVTASIAGGAIFVLTPLYANHVLARSSGLVGPLQSGAFRFSLLEVGVGVGALLGSLLAPALTRRWPGGRVFGLGMLGLGVSAAALAVLSNLYLALAAIALSGVFNSVFLIPALTLAQKLTPSDIRGRVLAVRVTLINGGLVLGSAVGGPLVLVLSYGVLWLLLGSIVAGASLLVWLHPEVRGQT